MGRAPPGDAGDVSGLTWAGTGGLASVCDRFLVYLAASGPDNAIRTNSPDVCSTEGRAVVS